MSGFLNFIKGLFGSIFGIFGRGKQTDAIAETKPKRKKSSGYFLELEDAKSVGNSASAASNNPAPAKPAEPVAVAAEPVAAATPTQPEAAPTKKPSARKAKLAAAEKTELTQPDSVAANNGLNLPQPTVTNFATEYLIPKVATPRRRPGANMSNFLDMARQVKTPG